ncbi:MAG TPA: SLC13 family permease [Anaerolineae bacterium]|nr:SLC13 family permease [Anaerolineae bacterium]
MTIEIALVLAILVGAIILFVTEWLRMDLVALLVLLILTLTGLVTPTQAFSGFSSPAVLTVGAIFVVSNGLLRTGVANAIGDRILRLAGTSEVWLIVTIMATVGLMSSVMNNIGATAVLLPVVISIARQTKISPSKLLIPLSTGSLLGGVATLIGTPPNILVADMMQQRGLVPFSFFDFTPLGLLGLGAGIAFMVLVGRHLLPDRPLEDKLVTLQALQRQIAELYQLRERLFEMRVLPHSPLVGKTIAESHFGQRLGLTILGIIRNREPKLAPSKEERLLADDLLLVEGKVEDVLDAQRAQGVEVEREVPLDIQDLQSEEIGVVEAVLSPRSSLVGRTLAGINFRDRFGLTVLAIWREGRPRRTGLANLPLRFGDALLLQGPWDKIRLLQSDPDFVILGAREPERVRTKRAPLAVAILLLTLAPVVLGWLPIATAGLMGACLMVLLRCLTMEEAMESIDWPSILLIAGMLPLGTAMQMTGAARFLADLVVEAVGHQGPFALLTGLFIFTALLAEIMPNPAMAVLIVPIAIGAAQGTGINPRALLMAVTIAINRGSITPMSHPAHALVMGPGNYHFPDYFKVGLPLTLVIMVVTLLALPFFFPLTP